MRSGALALVSIVTGLFGCASAHPIYPVATVGPPLLGFSQKDLLHIWSFRGEDSLELAAFYAAQRSLAEGWRDKPKSHQIIRLQLKARSASGEVSSGALAAMDCDAPVRGSLVCFNVSPPSFARIAGPELQRIDPPENGRLVPLVADLGRIVVAKLDDTTQQYTWLYEYDEKSPAWKQERLAADCVWSNGVAHLIVRGNEVSRMNGRAWAKTFPQRPELLPNAALRGAAVALIRLGDEMAVLDVETGDEVLREENDGLFSALDDVFLIISGRRPGTGRIFSRRGDQIWAGSIGSSCRLLRAGSEPVLGMSDCVVFAASGRRVPIPGTPLLIVGDEVVSTDEWGVYVTSIESNGVAR